MRKRNKAIIGVISLVFACIACVWLWPYIWYMLLVSSFTNAAQGRIHCWIKVVDQNKIGISGYKLRIVEHHAPLLPFVSSSGRVRILQTKKNGVLEYKSRGPVGVVYIGYDLRTQWRINPKTLFQSSGYMTLTTLKHRKGVKDNPTGYLGSKSNPYMLHVFSLGPPQKLLYNKVVIVLKDPKDYFCMDILSGKTWESKTPEGDIAMQDHPYERNKDVPCIITFVSGENCALYPVVDDWGLGPPKQGYKRNLCWTKDWMDIQRQTYNRIQVYFLLRTRRVGQTLYGKINFGISRHVNYAIIECFTNLQGRRNLYFLGYERSVMTFEPGQIQDYVSPPVKLEDLAAAQEKEK